MKEKICTFLLSLLIVSFDLKAQLVPTPDHVVVIVLENHGYDLIIGAADAPYINSLANDSFGALFTSSHGLTHPSQPNYMYLFSGDNQNVILDFTPISLLLPFTTPNLGASLLQNGRTFVGYSEDLPSVGYTGDVSGAYHRKHAPWICWQDGTTNGIPAALNQPFTAFPSHYDSLPTLCFVIPNQDHDMHDGTIAQCDTWLQSNIDAYVQWAKAHNSLLIITFDEDEGLVGANQIPTIFIGQMVKHGQYSETIDHNNVLRTMEDMYGLPYAGASSSSAPIVDCWVYKPVSNLSAAPVAMCPGQTVVFTDSTTNLPTTTQWLFEGGDPASSILANPSVTYDSAGVYDVTLISANQMGADTLIKHSFITVHPVPVVSLNTDTAAICNGDTAIITASGASVYSWLPEAGLLSSSGNIMKANPNANTNYQVVGMLNGCISDTTGVVVTVDSVIYTSLSITPAADTVVCSGTSVNFLVSTVNGGNNPFYQWKLNGSNVGSHSPAFSALAFGNNFTVSCVFTSSATCASPSSINSPVIDVAVVQAPHPVITAADSALSSSAAVNYQWFLNGQPIAGADSQNYIAPVSGVYTVEAFSAAGCSGVSNPVTVTLATSGINEVNSEAINLYPNPNTGEFTLVNPGTLRGECLLRLFDVSGRQVYQSKLSLKAGPQPINLESLHPEPGAYLLVLGQGNTSVSAKVFIH